MSFASYEFLFGFLPLALLAVYAAEFIDRKRLLLPALIGVSIVFYGLGSLPHLFLLLAIVAVTWLISQTYARFRAGRYGALVLAVGILANLSALLVWKYGNSLVEVWNGLGLVHVETPGIIMPLGISFYVIQQIGYLLDLRRGRAEVLAPLPYLAFVLFFPQLIAGPIVTQRRMGRELAKATTGQGMQTRLDLAYLGLGWFAVGLFKKVVLADGLRHIAGPLIAEAQLGPITTLEAWQVAIAPMGFVYFDFCGYSEMAVGLALLFGIRLPANFNAPYRARSVREFWTRWHITFHHFLRDHVYGPLVRKLANVRYGMEIALFVAILVSTLWHGNSIRFLIWGIFVYISIIMTRFLTPKIWSSFTRTASVIATIAIFLIMTVLFVSPDVETAGRVFSAMLIPRGALPQSGLFDFAIILSVFGVAYRDVAAQTLLEADRNHRERVFFGWRPPAFAPNAGWILALGTALLVSFYYAGRSPEFIYFGI